MEKTGLWLGYQRRTPLKILKILMCNRVFIIQKYFLEDEKKVGITFLFQHTFMIIQMMFISLRSVIKLTNLNVNKKHIMYQYTIY